MVVGAVAVVANRSVEPKVIAAILVPLVIGKVVAHLALQGRAPPCTPASGPQLQAA